MQHDMTLDNAAGAAFRADANEALQALVSNSAGATAPAVTFANMFWADTTANQLKQRNTANTAWVVVGTLDLDNFGLASEDEINMAGGINEAKTSVASAATPDIWTGAGNLIDLTGTATISGFAAAPQAGARRTLIAAAASSITAGANVIIAGWPTGTYKLAANDKVHVLAMTTTQFLLEVVRADGGSLSQIGEGFDSMDDSTPAYALLADGSAISRTAYSNLFARISTLHGVGDGSTTFNLPNIPANYTTVQASSNEGTSTAGTIPSHNHAITSVGNSGTGSSLGYTRQGSGSLQGNLTSEIAAFGTGSNNLAAGLRVRKCIRF